MKHLWSVAVYEYRRNVIKKSFILMLLSVPFFIGISISLGLFMESVNEKPLPVGYVDQAGILANAREINPIWTEKINHDISFIAFTSPEKATIALKEGVIQAYYLIRSDYFETRTVDQFHIEEIGENAWSQFFDYIQINLLSSQSPEVAYRAAAGTTVIVRSLDAKRTFSPEGPSFGLMMPLFITLGFLIMILMSSGYTLSAVTEEKENRTLEVLITSISPAKLINGKIISIIAIGLTLLFVWTLIIILGFAVAQQFGLGWLSDLSMDWRIVLSTLVIGIPAYALSIALMTTIGAMVTTNQEGQSVSSVFVILHLLPLYISWLFFKDPHTPIAVVLSILPFTSLLSLGMRNLFTIVPTWQIIISLALQIIFALIAFWLAGRALRMGMLRYGQCLNWRRLLGKMKES